MEHKSINKFLFKGDPNQVVIDKQYGRELFRFDEKGEFLTDNLRIIGKAVGHFGYIELKDGTKLEVKEEIVTEASYTCEKCGKEFKNKGLFTAHTNKCKGVIEE